jgi:serine/threonine protein kinase
LRRSGDTFSKKHLKSIAISLLHIHDHGLVHGDFGTHNVAKFGDRWKILGIGGSIEIGHKTNPKRGFFLPPEAVVLETRNVSLGEKNVGAQLVSISAKPSYDAWAFGTIIYEALAGLPLSPYRSAYKAKRAMTTAELFKVGQWDNRSLRKALRHVNDENAQDLIKKLLHPDPESRVQSIREVLEHPYFGIEEVAENGVFIKPLLAKRVDRAALKIYSDEFMVKMGWTDADVAGMFLPPEISQIDDDMVVAEEDEKTEYSDLMEEDKIEVEDIQSESNNFTGVPGQQASIHDEFVSFVKSPARQKENDVGSTERILADDSHTISSTSQVIPAKHLPDCEQTNAVVSTTQPQSTSPPPPPPVSTTTLKTDPLSSTKSKSRFSVKGLKSKFGKK